MSQLNEAYIVDIAVQDDPAAGGRVMPSGYTDISNQYGQSNLAWKHTFFYVNDGCHDAWLGVQQMLELLYVRS